MKPHKWGQLWSLTLPGKQASVYFRGSDPGCPLAQLLSLRVGPKPGCPAILTWMEVWGKKPFGEPEGMSDSGRARTLLLGQFVSTLPAFYLAEVVCSSVNWRRILCLSGMGQTTMRNHSPNTAVLHHLLESSSGRQFFSWPGTNVQSGRYKIIPPLSVFQGFYFSDSLYVCVCVCECKSVCMYVSVYIYVSVGMSVCMGMYVCECVYICKCGFVSVGVFVCMGVYVYECGCVYVWRVHVCVCVQVYMCVCQYECVCTCYFSSWSQFLTFPYTEPSLTFYWHDNKSSRPDQKMSNLKILKNGDSNIL